MRHAMTVALLGLALTALPARAAHAQVVQTGDVARRGLAERDFPRARPLAPGVWSYEALRAGDPGGKMTTVSLVVVTGDGVLVADGQGNVAQTREMVDWIARTTSQPIRWVVVASDHGDHTAGNAAFPAGVTYLATPASARALAASPSGAPARIDTVVGKRVLQLGGTTVEVLDLGRAHTGGDLSVHLPRERVLFLSEAYLHWIFPAMRSAYPREWVETLKKAEAMHAEWVVPGHGFVDDAATLARDLPAFRRAVEQVIAEATRLHAAGVPCASRTSCDAVARGDWGALRRWTLFESQAPIAVRRVYDEIEGKLGTPATVPSQTRSMTTQATGTFVVQITPQPADAYADGAALGRMTLDKTFQGDLQGTGRGQMLTGMSSVKGSAGYVAIERVTGTLAGRRGSFVLQHSGTMDRGAQSLAITVVPDSGTEELTGIAGTMTITVTPGQHAYAFRYTLPAAP